MKINALLGLLGWMVAGIWCSQVQAGIVFLQPSRDNSIYSENNNSNALGSLIVGRTANTDDTRRALLSFDLASSIPTGATINSVSLQLFVRISGPSSGADSLSVHQVTSSWGEGTSLGTQGAGGRGGAPTLNDATWNSRFYNTSTWTTPGGDFATDASGTITLDGLNTSFLFDNQPGMLVDVQNWLDNPISNNGWLLKYDDEISNGTARGFWSREANAELRPVLTVDFTAVPEPGAFLLLGSAFVAASAWRCIRRSAQKKMR